MPRSCSTTHLRALYRVAAHYGLDSNDARNVIDAQIAIIEDNWQEVADAAGLREGDRNRRLGRQFLDPGALRS